MKSLKLLAVLFILTGSSTTLSALSCYQHLKLANSYQALSELERENAKQHLANAIKYYHKAKTGLTNTPDKDYNSIFYLAEIYHALSKLEPDKAKEYLTNAKKYYNDATTELLINFDEHSDNYLPLAKSYRALSQLEPDKAVQHFAAALIYFRQAEQTNHGEKYILDFVDVAEIYRALSQLEPDNSEHLDNARKCYGLVVDQAPSHLFLNLAKSYHALHELESDQAAKDAHLVTAIGNYNQVITRLKQEERKYFRNRVIFVTVAAAGLFALVKGLPICFKAGKSWWAKKAAPKTAEKAPTT